MQFREKRSRMIASFVLCALVFLAESTYCQLKYESSLGIHHQNGGPDRSRMYSKLEAESRLPYHNGETLICSDCHSLHASMQHDYDGAVSPGGTAESYPATLSLGPFLLKSSDPLDLCLTCHDNISGIPDVVMADANGLAERSAGFFDGADVVNPRGHDLGRGLAREGAGLCTRCHAGSAADRKVTCIDCHDPHGNGNPRNLQWASNPANTPPLGLFNPDGISGLAKYEHSNTAYGTLNSVALREVTSICIDCHHMFTGSAYNDPDGDDIHSLHPSYDSERSNPVHISDGAVRGSTNTAHWENGTGSGFAGTQRVPFVVDGAADYSSGMEINAANNGVFCLSCHKAHGSSSVFSLVWPAHGSVGRTGCGQCHLMRPSS